MKTLQTGYLVIEALVYAGLLMFTALLVAQVLVHMAAFERHIMQQVTSSCQGFNALALIRRDLIQAPSKRTDYSVLAPTEITYARTDGTLSWRLDKQRLLRLHEHKQGSHILRDHAVVLESVSACIFTPQIVYNQVRAFSLKLSHNSKVYSSKIFLRSAL